jgi:hypothetical protein
LSSPPFNAQFLGNMKLFLVGALCFCAGWFLSDAVDAADKKEWAIVKDRLRWFAFASLEVAVAVWLF